MVLYYERHATVHIMSKSSRKNKTIPAEAAPPATAPTYGIGSVRFTLQAWVRIIIALQMMFLAKQFQPELCTNGDNAVYYILGKSIAEGEGYRDIHVAGSPKHRSFPVVFPAFLSLTAGISKTPLPAKIAVGILGALVILCCYRLFRDRLGSEFTLAFVVIIAASWLLAEYQVILMAEIPFLLLTLLAILARRKSYDKPDDKRWFWVAGTAAVLPVHCHSIGVAFSAAWVVDCLLSRRYKYAMVHVALVALTVVGPGILGAADTGPDIPSKGAFAAPFIKNVYDPEMGTLTLKGVGMRMLGNIRTHFLLLLPKAFQPYFTMWPLNVGQVLAHLTLGLVFLGLLRALFSRYRIVALYVVLYAGILAVWPIASERRIVNIFPFLALFAVDGLGALVRLFDCRRPHPFFAILRTPGGGEAAPLTAQRKVLVWGFVAILALPNLWCRLTMPPTGTVRGSDWANFYSCADWIRMNTPPDAVVLNRKQELFYLRSKRQGCMYPYTHDVDKIVDFLREKGVTHVVYDNFGWTRTTAKYLYPVIASHPDHFRVLYALKGPDTFVLEFVDR